MMEPKRTGHDSFAHVLRTEWTMFRNVRGWMIAMVIAALLTVLLGLAAAAVGTTCNGPRHVCPAVLVGPDGEAVTDKFYFVHQPLAGDGSITVRVISLTGLITYPPPNHNQIVRGVVPWAKAGVIIKESTTQGSAYAAMMITGSHGVRMQDNFTQDIAGFHGLVSAESPRWLRLTREGPTLTGYESTDGVQWSRVGTAHLDGLPTTVQVGLFVTSPCNLTVDEGACRLTQATATFDHVRLQGNGNLNTWTGTSIGSLPGAPALSVGSLKQSGETFTVTGSGDIAPSEANGGWPIEHTLIGAVVGLIVVMAVAVLFVTDKSSASRIRASERTKAQLRQKLAAKAIVIGLVTFTTQLVAAIVVIQLGTRIMLANGTPVLPVSLLTELRIMVGMAALVGVTAVFALAIGALVRSRVVAVTMSLALTVLPFFLAFANLAPETWSQWMLRFTPAAGFAIQQSISVYPQVIDLYTPQNGYYPLAPWVGFTVLCGYTALALALAMFLPRHKDAKSKNRVFLEEDQGK